MILLHPIWLFLAIPLAVSVWIWWPPSRAMLVLRILSLVLVLMALCGVSLSLPSHAGTVVVVVDHSLSMPVDSESVQKEAIDMIQASMSSDDRLGVVTFGDGAVVERVPQTGKFAGFLTQVNRDASDLAGALERALALIPRDNPGHVLILSDGRWTGRDPSAIAALAAVREVALDYRPMQRPLANDLAIARVEAPATVNPGEAFLLTAWVQAPTSQMVSYELRRGTRRLASGQRQMTAGLNRLTFRDRAVESGNQPYTLTVTGTSEDPWPENNTAHILVGVQGPRPLLCITSSPRSGLPRLLQAGGLQVKSAAPDACTWSLEELARYSAVLLENVPAEKIGMTGMETLATWVRETGSGLMVTGGKASYGTGGYYRSPLEPILPVTMELRNEHRKLSLAIVVALDRSGSMAMPVGGGRVKMDLANLGTVAVLDLLGPRDEFGVIAVDTDAHIIANLHELKDKEAVRNDVLGIRSMGGGHLYRCGTGSIFAHDSVSTSRHQAHRTIRRC